MKYYRTWLEISRFAIKDNVARIKEKISKNVLFLAVIKGNAWGYGTLAYAKTLLNAGIDWIGVTTIEDALLLRENGFNLPILILCEFPAEMIRKALTSNLRLTVCTEEIAKEISYQAGKASKQAKVHVKINTGLNRIGVSPVSALSLFQFISRLPNVEIEGAFTHFSCADRIRSEITGRQLRIFLKEVKKAREAGIKIKIIHAANTAAALSLPKTHLDMVRIGMGIAGLYPSEEFKRIATLSFPLTWKSYVSYVRTVTAGERVGYCGRYRCARDITIVTIPVGTADGLSKRFEDRGFIAINGVKYPVVAVSMDQAMVNIGKVTNYIKTGDEVVIVGKQRDIYLDPVVTAKEIGADVEELLCQISYRVPRVSLRGDDE